MALLPLSPDGLATKLKQLYKLHTPDRELLADVIIDDFKGFITDNFLLSIEEKTYLHRLDSITSSYLASQFAMCIKHKLPIEVKEMVPPTDIGYRLRIIFSNQILISTFNNCDMIEAEGKLRITSCYTYDN